MSKTFTSRPSVVRNRNPNIGDQNQRSTATGSKQGAVPKTNRGRGSMASGRGGLGRGSTSSGYGRSVPPPNIGRGTSSPMTRDQESQPVETPNMDQRMSYQGCFTMISPNEKKKQEIQQQASKETENYQKYKEQQKIGHMSYVGTAESLNKSEKNTEASNINEIQTHHNSKARHNSGGQVTQEEARRKLIQENRNPSMRLREKREDYRSQQRKKEEEEINQKRDKQRELANRNVSRAKQTEIDSRNKWDEDRKRKTDKFLSRFEGKSSNNSESSTDKRSLSIDPSLVQNTALNSQDSTPIDIAGASWSGNCVNDNTVDHVDTLHSMFPHFDRTVLREILDQTQSVEGALDVLQAE